MDEILEEKVEEVSTETSEVVQDPPKQTWKEWFGTEDAVRWVYLIFGFFAIVMLVTMLQFSTDAVCCGDWDGYYHIRWSALLWDNFKHGHWLPTFNWLPLTVLGPDTYADHHFLFHLLQIPFLWFFEPVMAAKVAAVFYSSLAIFSVYWLLFYYRVQGHLLLWLGAILTCANPFFYRMSMAKAPPLTIIYSVAGIYLLFERKYIWLLPLMFVFVWTYSLFPLLFIAAIFWVMIIAWNERKFEWQPLAYTGGGMILGNLINPYFPQNLGLFFEHFWTKFKIDDFAVPVGGEWYPYSGVELLTHFPVAMIAMLFAYVLFMPKNNKLPEKATFFLMFVTVLLVSQFRSKRFAEYFPPFAILFAGFVWQAFQIPNTLELPEDFKREIEPYLDANKKTEKQQYVEFFKQAVGWTMGVFFCLLLIYNFRGIEWGGIKQEGMITSIRSNEPNTKYQAAMTWLNDNAPAGERIFNCNWDDFPKMFYYGPKFSFVYGLDPNYLYSKNPDLYKRLTEITGGKVDDPAPEIRDKFGAKYIFTDAKENTDMVAKLLESGWTDKVFEDDEAIILKIRDQKGEAPTESKDDDAESQLTDDEKKQLDEEMKKEEKKANKEANKEPNVEEEVEP
ncbi:MAG TPA: hypothetical protein PKY82_01905 [Pyrinomonadaceae bacterium]|nr:hypothetical protein [Pyrinomonadaceae bacterium]